jgi:hypothetical protein
LMPIQKVLCGYPTDSDGACSGRHIAVNWLNIASALTAQAAQHEGAGYSH